MVMLSGFTHKEAKKIAIDKLKELGM